MFEEVPWITERSCRDKAQSIICQPFSTKSPGCMHQSPDRANAASSFSVSWFTSANAHDVIARFYAVNSLRHYSEARDRAMKSFSSLWVTMVNAQATLARSCWLSVLTKPWAAHD
eukprot:gnl/TRDRNA2_/TRDRNA2_168340_c1_seq7.p1 gnl/TRDRNA2_/TRDRNA2_168340_c1~~gnl/TRDRNA2_/TRDRNA2_168340_c1_seq7.p1  ORF type:complete len:115 (-),score=1.85 gnl/TRDRNA2_/TRDRNA2_168340_c1_seq7:65-409(-)